MANVFKEQMDVHERVNLNNHDLFFQNHLTTKIGQITPFMCKLFVPNDRIRIKTGVNFKFMPLALPLQSHMRVQVSYIAVPIRTIWPNFKEFLAGTNETNGDPAPVHPYIVQEKGSGFFKTGSLADYLDVPTTFVENSNLPYTVSINGITGLRMSFASLGNSTMAVENIPLHHYVPDVVGATARYLTEAGLFLFGTSDNTFLTGFTFDVDRLPEDGRFYFKPEFARMYPRVRVAVSPVVRGSEFPINGLKYETDSDLYLDFVDDTSLGFSYIDIKTGYPDIWAKMEQSVALNGNARVLIYFQVPTVDGRLLLDETISAMGTGVSFTMDASNGIDADDYDKNPFYPQEDGSGVRISALPFRAYEAAVNCYYRNPINQPFIVNGKKVYNRFNTEQGDGPDKTPYKLEYRDWELDFLTSSMPSPQAGVAPLVGMTATGAISVTDDNGNVTNARVGTLADGSTLDGTISITNPAASDQNNRTLSQAAMLAAGMSINDFRNVNSYQRFLEQTLRSGYRYFDFMRGHHGRGPKKAELDMPIFLGGFNEDIKTAMVTQTSQGDDEHPLGSYAGQMFASGSGGHSINYTFDDYTYLLGLVTIIPDPAYSQLLPKHFLTKNRLDYFFPEFTNLGMQPITYAEVCPIEAAAHGTPLTDTFGYNRPNYDMVSYTDQVHGQFRLTLRNMLINRVFNGVPELGDEFLKMSPSECNNIFTYQAPDEDNVIGQVIVDIKAKRPVPRVSIPSLGR